MKTAIQRFKWVAFFEGTSFLVLLFICTPLKHVYGIPEPTRIVGMAHGILTVLYIVTLIDFGIQHRISFLKYFQFFVASLLPFGTFYAEKKWLRPLMA